MKGKGTDITPDFDYSPVKNMYHYARLQRKTAEAMSLLRLAEVIVSDTEGCQMATDALNHVRTPLRVMAERLGCTEMGAFFMSWMLNNFNDRHLLVVDLARQLLCSNITILTYWKDIEMLRDLHYIRMGEYNGETFFQVPNDVMEAIRENRAYSAPSYSGLDEDMFLDRLGQLCKSLDGGFLNGTFFLEELQSLIEANPTLKSAGWLSATPNTPDMRGLMAVTIAHHLAGDYRMAMSDIETLFSTEEQKLECRRSIMLNKHFLQRAGWIEPVCMSGQAVPMFWCLSNKAVEEILSNASMLLPEDKRGMIQPETIAAKQLYFRPAMEIELGKLRHLLSQDRFPKVQETLEENGMRRGVACIFYGAPGTGKTETVLQLARETGRAIMKVDISAMRDKYVGESEKQIKGVFDRYRMMCRSHKVTPILLFNEADAVFTRRNEQASNSTDKMENAMQNIILEEMEKLDGILIATTNLAQSLDSAFERRFLYKLEFQNPSPEESCRIWSSMVKNLSDEDAYALAKEFRFSGGQIENVARKQIISSLLDDQPIRIEGLREFCQKESLKKENRIGFS